jgi:hypothetical protein
MLTTLLTFIMSVSVASCRAISHHDALKRRLPKPSPLATSLILPIITVSALLIGKQATAQIAAQPQSATPETPTEIISGQSRAYASKPRRSEPSTVHSRTDHAPFLTPLAPLPKGPYYGKIKRPRKHRLDQDRDGFVSKHELELENQTRSAAFREADQNQDGKLDPSEMRRYQALVHPRVRGRH